MKFSMEREQLCYLETSSVQYFRCEIILLFNIFTMILISGRWINKDYEIEEKLLMKYENNKNEKELTALCVLRIEIRSDFKYHENLLEIG